MADFNSLEEAYADIITHLGEGLYKALEQAKTIAIDYIISNWYSKYPESGKENSYDRLKLMTESLQTKYVLNGSSLEAILFVRDDLKHPASNSWNKQPVTFSYLYDWFEEYYGEQGILEHTQEELEGSKIVLNIIQSELRKAGYDFV